MEADKIELLDTFNKLDPESKADILAYARIAFSAQESAKRRVLEMITSQPEYSDRRSAPMAAAVNA